MKYRKLPLEVEAMQFVDSNWPAILDFMGWNWPIEDREAPAPKHLIIDTENGDMLAWKTDWIIKGADGEFYPCKNNIFERSYVAVAPSDGETCSKCDGHGVVYVDDGYHGHYGSAHTCSCVDRKVSYEEESE